MEETFVENESHVCDSQQGATDRSGMKGVGRWFEESETGRSEEGARWEGGCGVFTKNRAERA